MRSVSVTLTVVVCGLFLGLVGCGSSSMTKDEWKAKVEKDFPGFLVADKYPEKAKFTSAMGKPARTQTVGGDLYWYYRCSDGMIQIKLAVVPGRENIMVLSAINDY
jgi:hypothetical protein